VIIVIVPRVERPAGTVLGVSAVAYATGALLCHQKTERSFHVHGTQMPVCARCTALYLSGAVGALAGWLGRAREPRRARSLLLLGALPVALSVLLEGTGLIAGSNLMRAAAALPAGSAAGWVLVRMLRSQARGMRYDLVV
jgi:uncharacterized membrane protein